MTQMLRTQIKRDSKRLAFYLAELLGPTLRRFHLDRPLKHLYEYAYWVKTAHKEEGGLHNHLFESFWTELCELPRSLYSGKRVLDLGCGPRGTLEWLDDAQQRIGLDPLVKWYRHLGIDRHQMTYVNAASEQMPFADASFDVVGCFNAIDHVDDVDATVSEIKRVTAPGGIFLLVVDVHPRPTIAEPHAVDWKIIDRFRPEFETEDIGHFEAPDGAGAIDAVRSGVPFDHSNATLRYGALRARLRRVDCESGPRR